MSKSILNSLDELVDQSIIDRSTAKRIEDYFGKKPNDSSNKLLALFSILGSVLVGLGIILMIAYNWDDLSRGAQTAIAFTPLFLTQAFHLFTYLKKQELRSWREASSILVFFAVGASIALISQIYNLPGNLDTFILTWVIVCLPFAYTHRSYTIVYLFILGITYYACSTNYFQSYEKNFTFWYLQLLIVPFIVINFKQSGAGYFKQILIFALLLSITTCLGTFSRGDEEVVFALYLVWFFLLYQLSFLRTSALGYHRLFTVFGVLGLVSMLSVLSYSEIWESIPLKDFDVVGLEGLATLILSVCAIALLFINKNFKFKHLDAFSTLTLPVVAVFLFDRWTNAGVYLSNIALLLAGIQYAVSGIKNLNFKLLNAGLIILTVFISCRFFDGHMSILLRGILFILLGISFFVSNYFIIRKKKTTLG